MPTISILLFRLQESGLGSQDIPSENHFYRFRQFEAENIFEFFFNHFLKVV